MAQMRQLRALGKNIRVPQSRMNEILARSLPTMRGLRDEREYRTNMYNLSKDQRDLERKKLAYEKNIGERTLKQQAKDSRRARQLMYGKTAADLALGVGGAYLGGDDAVNEITSPAIETLPEVVTDISSDTLNGVVDNSSSLWGGDKPVEFAKPDFISETADSIGIGAGDFLRKFAGDSGVENLYSDTIGKLFSFDVSDNVPNYTFELDF